MTATELLETRYDAFQKALENETDRGLAIIWGGYCEDLLDELLQRSSIRVGKRLSPRDKIDLASTKGLITSDFQGQLHRFRKIRNDFAHDHRLQDFNDIKDSCDALTELPAGLAELGMGSDEIARTQFTLAMSYAMPMFQLLIRKATPMS